MRRFMRKYALGVCVCGGTGSRCLWKNKIWIFEILQPNRVMKFGPELNQPITNNNDEKEETQYRICRNADITLHIKCTHT